MYQSNYQTRSGSEQGVCICNSRGLLFTKGELSGEKGGFKLSFVNCYESLHEHQRTQKEKVRQPCETSYSLTMIGARAG